MLSKIQEFKYYHIALFLLLYGVFYWGNNIYTGLTVPGGKYVPFLDHYLNYVTVYRNFLLQCSAFLIRLTGQETFIYDHGIHLRTGGVKLIYACLGFAIFSFWWAMILAFPQTRKNKLMFFLGGTAIIIVLNIIRITAVALVFSSEWGRTHRGFDHHMLFNIVVYCILFYMLYRWFNLQPPAETKPEPSQN